MTKSKVIKFTENEVAVLFEAYQRYDEDFSVGRSAFDKLDIISTRGGIIILNPSERVFLRRVARTIESYEVKKYKISKARLIRKLR